MINELGNTDIFSIFVADYNLKVIDMKIIFQIFFTMPLINILVEDY